MTREEMRVHVGMAVGHASMCWEKHEKAGVFDDKEAVRVVDLLMAKIDEYAAPNTNKDL